MKRSKKGVTLVELVICCTIIVLLGGACSAVLASGATIFNQSANTANAQMDAEVLYNYLIKIVPAAQDLEQVTVTEAKAKTTGCALYFDVNEENENCFIIQVNGKQTTIRSITEFEYQVLRAGDPASDTARAQLLYTAKLSDGNTLEGGFVLSNVKYTSAEISGVAKLSQNPLFLGDSE